MDKDIKYWHDLAVYDKGTAEAMYKSGRYLYVLFMCQQAVEKMLKGLVVQVTKEFPPRTHDLERLANLCKVKADKAQMEMFRALTAYYIQTRYPEDIQKISADIDKKKAAHYLKETKELLKWLKGKLK